MKLMNIRQILKNGLLLNAVLIAALNAGQLAALGSGQTAVGLGQTAVGHSMIVDQVSGQPGSDNTLEFDSLPDDSLNQNRIWQTQRPKLAIEYQSNKVYAQNSSRQFRSEGEVVREVKRNYQAKVLKIRLNEKRGVYLVRVLLPSGKVKSITVNARR